MLVYRKIIRVRLKTPENDEDNEQAIALAEELAHRPNRTLEESALYNLLIALIEKYEQEHYPMEQSTPHSMLLHLMEARDLKQADLVQILGSSGVVSEIINGKQKITMAEAKALAEFFNVDSALFL
ncbi:helix-turn-helix domain-containing protein [Scytonema tolypothrichoides VB-61278]|nr:helix-turn-helix domain-containing protein [Scytonema tolypothrichoides VB-61278]